MFDSEKKKFIVPYDSTSDRDKITNRIFSDIIQRHQFI